MISLEALKDSLFEFIEFKREPFDVDFIYRQCIQPVDKHQIYEVLHQLELEGKIIRLSDGRYITTKIAIKRWLSRHLVDVKIPKEIAAEAEGAMRLLPRTWRTIDSFISEAIKEYIEKVLNVWDEELHRVK